jgi:hypothetical protein
MKKKSIGLSLLAAVVFGIAIVRAQQSATPKFEYVTIRWGGRDNTHVIRPGGTVEFIGIELRKLPKPNAADERAFYMNAALNGLAAQGFEIAAMTSDDVVMRRTK